MKLKICLMGLLCLFLGRSAKAKIGDKGLKIGDAVPDLIINDIINYKSNSVKISDFKGKILILDFWATWCGNCIASFPNLNTVQRTIPDNLQILLVDTKVTRDKPDNIRKFFAARAGQYLLPSVMMDTALDKLFPHHTIPHEIWIKNNQVIAITDASQVTVINVLNAFNNKEVALERKALIRLDNAIPATVKASGISSCLFRSTLTAFDADYQQWQSVEQADNGSYTKIDFVNYSRIMLINASLVEGSFYSDRMILDVKDKSLYASDSSSGSWDKHNCFSYEFSGSPMSRTEILRHMRSDMEDYLHIRIDTIVEHVKCFRLNVIDTNKIKKGEPFGHGDSNIQEHSGKPVFFTDLSLDNIGNRLETVLKLPFLSEQNAAGKINLTLPAALKDMVAVQQALLKQGIRLTEFEADVTFLRIADKDSPGHNEPHFTN